MRSIRGREIGMIFQEPMNTLNPVTTIGEQLIETMQNETMTKTVKKEQAQELLLQAMQIAPQAARPRLEQALLLQAAGEHAKAFELLAEIDRPNVAVQLDCYHAWIISGDVLGWLRES